MSVARIQADQLDAPPESRRPSTLPLKRTFESRNLTINPEGDRIPPRTSIFETFPQFDDENTRKEFVKAKSFFLKVSPITDMNLYDHLTRLFQRILREQPPDLMEKFEDYSFDEKRFAYRQPNFIRKRSIKTTEVKLAELEYPLFKSPFDDVRQGLFDDSPLPNLLESHFYFEGIGVGLAETETMRLWLSMQDLLNKYPSIHTRFWGKIFGMEKNYYIVEADLENPDGVLPEDRIDVQPPPLEEPEDHELQFPMFQFDDDMNDIPKPQRPNKVKIPAEETGQGTNKYSYFVCNAPGLPWKLLPNVEPEQIVVARQIRRLLTGRLDAPVVTYPAFPGKECNLLRAQIARISGTTLVSPAGYYIVGEEEGDDEGSAGSPSALPVLNEEFEPLPVSLLTENLESWVHHGQFLLNQGRCVWHNSRKRTSAFDDEDEAERDEEDSQELVPEFAPAALTALSEDHFFDEIVPWSVVTTSKLLPQFAVAAVRCNMWPGAYTVAYGKKFENIYVGWGIKGSLTNYDPVPSPLTQNEFQDTFLQEVDDPTPEEEKAHRAMMMASMMNEEMGEEPDDQEDEDEELEDD